MSSHAVFRQGTNVRGANVWLPEELGLKQSQQLNVVSSIVNLTCEQ